MSRNEISQEIINTCLKMSEMGLNQGTSGNISVRYEKGMLITPTSVPYEYLSPDDIVYVDMNGQSEPGKNPSSEWRFHLDILKSKPEEDVVLHNHAVCATAVAVMNKEIPAIHYMVAAAGGNIIPCAPYATYGSQALSDNAVKALKGYKATLLQHHGMITTAKTLEKALWLAQEVEVLAKLYLSILPIMNPAPILSDAQLEEVLVKFHGYGLRDAK
ncbi:L-fuculose-phosphate aldolase [Brenneria izadpanahii]|uniref:L-fuculose-phosphate aldolase n=1 Tax=Brenneria izadpanahii TaxID=2722756 RepID=A0ABX7UTU7_9GAMM|nr:L-fuculose-phosphate aldolase [Brenneria izadpanahii]QTF09116.1 L-fuculose-phosphate aldolase [Brenneria izadpanahii]